MLALLGRQSLWAGARATTVQNHRIQSEQLKKRRQSRPTTILAWWITYLPSTNEIAQYSRRSREEPLGITLKLGKLDMSGPYVTPLELKELWTEAKKYIKVRGDYKELFRRRRQGSYRVVLDLTLCVASNQELSDKDISAIENLTWLGFYEVQL